MKPVYSPKLRKIFDLYLKYRLRRSFAEVSIDLADCRSAQALLDPKLPVLLVANHVSWWDGFFVAEVQRALLPKAPLFTIMLEKELKSIPVFRKLGVLGVEPRKPATFARAFLNLKRLRKKNGALCVTYFPQGQITPQMSRPLAFQKGIEALIRALHPVQVVPIALHIEPLRSPKSTALIHVGAALRSDQSELTANELEIVIEQMLNKLAGQTSRSRLGVNFHGERLP